MLCLTVSRALLQIRCRGRDVQRRGHSAGRWAGWHDRALGGCRHRVTASTSSPLCCARWLRLFDSSAGDELGDSILSTSIQVVSLGNGQRRTCLLLLYVNGWQAWDVTDPETIQPIASVRGDNAVTLSHFMQVPAAASDCVTGCLTVNLCCHTAVPSHTNHPHLVSPRLSCCDLSRCTLLLCEHAAADCDNLRDSSCLQFLFQQPLIPCCLPNSCSLALCLAPRH